MSESGTSRLPDLLKKHETEILNEWLKEQERSGSGRARSLMKEGELQQQSNEMLNLLQQALQTGSVDINTSGYIAVREFLSRISRSRSLQGFSPSETATFVFSLKKPIFDRLRQELGKNAGQLADEVWAATQLIDSLGVYTTETYQKAREEVIARQQTELLELSTPVVKLWEGILALPLIGTLDSARTQVVMESLLHKIVEIGASVAIIDITGVPTVDTLVAQHLLKTVTAARLMGADCIISGIRPQIAQTIVHLGVNLGEVSTKASLADAFVLALQRTGTVIQRSGVKGQTSNGQGVQKA